MTTEKWEHSVLYEEEKKKELIADERSESH
jgi:hypothetical protein